MQDSFKFGWWLNLKNGLVKVNHKNGRHFAVVCIPRFRVFIAEMYNRSNISDEVGTGKGILTKISLTNK